MEPAIYILKNDVLEVHISTLGATITRMITRDKAGKPVDVILGMEMARDYETPEYVQSGAYLGAGIGRYANRIAGGKFSIDGQEYRLAVNNGPNHLHGGLCGFDRKIWEVVETTPASLEVRYLSPDGEENYPGNLMVHIRFEVEGKELKIKYQAGTDRKCYVNLTHHPYFNLNPAENDIKTHKLKLYTDKYLKTNDLIPDGSILTAEGEDNFCEGRLLKAIIEKRGGLDDCFVFRNEGKIVKQAELSSDASGIKLYVCSDYPGLQVYTGRYLDVNNAKGGKHYGAYAGVALEAQFWPDSPHHPGFPSTLLLPGESYSKTTIFGFE